MPNTYTAVIKEQDGWWIGWIEEIPGVNCQERSRDGLVDSLRVSLKEAIELNREGAIQAAEPGFIEEKVTV